ncbi:MAG: glycosyl transferase family 51 [Desulfobulbaceae bacterium]|nr:glycosyl transferase family 51 [Desulfobulbaceae bacterium]
MKKLFLFVTVTCVILATALLGGLYWFVVVEPGDEIKLENIHGILGRESHVFYSDGETKLGVFFDTAHRQYVSYSDIPKEFVNAMVASEDNRFFTHFGFDLVGIGRAMIKNIQAGRVVQGGSTLTQQTAKNLFKRTERSLEAKLKELVFALRLEYYYPKEKIFEFYANQFYVSGNGHGLGVAARYYFDKLPNELSLIECAFIAGSVKRPNYYNPFIKKTEQASELARSRAKTRLEYVLDKMQNLRMIDVFTYNETLDLEIEFKKGKVGYDLDYAMELVRDAVSSTEVLDALKSHDVTNIATSGVRVITTIDRGLQESTLAILRGELSRLDVRLRGYEREEVQTELANLDYTGDSALRKGAFLFGHIDSIEGKGQDIQVFVSLNKKLGQGVIDSNGLSGLVTARVRWQENRWSKSGKGDQAKLVAQLQPGDKVWVKVRVVPEILEDEPILLDLQKYPQLQGGALVIKDGAIKSMAGGVENRFFNRAIHARRTMGSAFKPLVYTAALQLGWNSADSLKNSRDVFVYHNQAYFPRPDHTSPYDWVSMSWAGVHSENLASVWLLSHLCDQLTVQQLSEVASSVGLGPKVVDGEKEPYRSYRARIRDRFGIQVNREVLRTTAYRLAVENLETDFIFDGLMREYEQLKELPYGLNYEKFSEDIDEKLDEEKETLKKYEVTELKFRKTLLANHYLLLKSLRKELTSYRSLIDIIVGFDDADSVVSSGGAALYIDRSTGEFHFMSMLSEKSNKVLMDAGELRGHLAWLDEGEKILFWENIRLNVSVTVGAFDQLVEQVEYEYQKLNDALPYSIEVLSQVEDFRITVGLYYLIRFAEQLGVKSRLEPVLSFPLGSNVVTLLEATRMYEGLVAGQVTTFGDSEEEESNDSMAILDRIESADGEILFQPQPVIKQVVDKKTRLSIGNVLENIVKFGTGRQANKAVRFQDDGQGSGASIADLNLTVPLLGKTGTANRYTNASFLGFLPGIAENGVAMTIRDGYAMGVYVGFDNNEPMRRNSSRITGSAGALPTWCGLANVLLQEQHYASRLDPVDLSFSGLGLKKDELGQMNVGVDPKQGGKVIEPVVQVSEVARFQPSIVTFGKKTDTGRFVMERNFQPFWKTAAVAE